MSNVTLFENMPESYKKIMTLLAPETNLGGGDFAGGVRLSIRGSVFRKVVNGKEIATLESRAAQAVIVKAAPISRMYYSGTYVEGTQNPPTCWSADGRNPSKDVIATDKQASNCNDCPMNIKGSGQGESKACRHQQRLVILLADTDGSVMSKERYQMIIPATSIFGDTTKGKMPMQAYARHLQAYNTPAAAIITEMRFDSDSSTPKLTFKPVRPLTQEELELVIEVQQDPETDKLLEISVPRKKEVVDDVPPAAAPALFAPEEPKKAPKKKPAAVVAEDDEEVEEEMAAPKVHAAKTKLAAPTGKKDLSSLLGDIDEWDDE